MREIAIRVGMSHESFRKRFTHTVGVPPAQYRARCIIHRAQELMRGGVLTNREIASRLGFCDEYYFSRRFKQITGISPRMYRQRLIEPASFLSIAGACHRWNNGSDPMGIAPMAYQP